ncbi:helix-turn-helix domain-containing protein [Agrococcus sp. 1P02AA]|uniref:PucR family transcriptional regulator n=1 Tax=Agrococcus sp. 1P02AA TaxID=3132259 RepID=UPI0039A426EA
MGALRLEAAHRTLLHELADAIGTSLEVPVEITDARLRSLARSELVPVEGHARSLRPDLSPRVRIPSGHREPIHVPPVEAIGLQGFWVVPIFGIDRLRVLLWVLDGDADRSAVEFAATAAHATVHGLDAAHAFDAASRESGLGAAPFDDRIGEVERAVAGAASEGDFQYDSVSVALAVLVEPASAHFATAHDLAATLGRTAQRGAKVLPARRVLAAQHEHEAIVLLAPFPQDSPAEALERAIAIVQDLLYRSQDAGLYGRWTIGTSAVVRHPDGPARAIWQARNAARTGLRIGMSGQVVEWQRAEQYHGLPQLPQRFIDDHYLTPELLAFFDDPENDDLTATLESFLEHAGNVQAVAAERFVHRTNVYHRLRRIETALAVDLGRGHDRLALHMALIAWRMRGGSALTSEAHERTAGALSS